jgi:tetratricopeptide (TPR) repeat protein
MRAFLQGLKVKRLSFRSLAFMFFVVYLLVGCYIRQQVRGHYYLDSKKHKQGISYFKEEIRNHPDDPSINYFLGRLYLAEKESKEGLRHLKRSVQLNPGKADYHFWLGVAYSANKMPALERKSYLKAISLNKKHYQALTYLGHIQFENQNLKAALDIYSEALAIRNDIPQALYNRALILKRLRRTPEEKIAWKKYLALYSLGNYSLSAVNHLNELGDFEYQNHRIGNNMIMLKEIQFEPFSAKITNSSIPWLDRLGRAFTNKKKHFLHIVAYQKNNIKLAEAKAKSIKCYLRRKFPDIHSKLIKVSWLGVSKTIRVGNKTYSLGQTVNFFTEREE